ncbi:hypothetical protein BGX24_000284 [Mortierella sp. AD032]|nr:hypothetical protein BGX24_000284 [Mortierella sp. AD032]
MSKDDHKERQRVTKDAKGDICSSCELLGVPCLYMDPTKKRGPPKGAGRYINAIEDRLHRMEAIVGGLVREDGSFHPTVDDSRSLSGLNSPTDPHTPHNRSSRDSYKDASDIFQQLQQRQQFAQHPNNQNLDHQHHPPALHDYNLIQQQQQHQQLPQHQHQIQSQQQFSPSQQQYSNRVLGFQQLSQSPDLASSSLPEGIQQVVEPPRTSPLHRDLIREGTFQSFDSPSPVLGSDQSAGDMSESPAVADNLPVLGISTPPVQEEVDDIDEDMGHLTLDQRGCERYVGKSSPMFYSRRHYGGRPADSPQLSQKPESRKFTENPDLPSPEVMTHLLNLHFTYVHPFAPVFVWSKFLKRLQERDYSPSFLFLLNSIFALASRYSDDISFRTDPAKSETIGVRFAEKAKEILDTLYDSSDMNCVGALVLLAFQQMGTGSGYRAWMYVGISIRMAQHLGLNRDCLKLNPHMSAIDREERNRIWWTCFMADRIMSTSFGRPQGINEHDVDATYPEGVDEENIQMEYRLEGATSMLTGPSPHSEQNFVFMASLMRILGRVMVSLYSPRSKASSLSTSSMTNPAPLEQLDKELTDWLLTLPPHLQFRSVQQEPGTFVCTLHMTFYAVLILLHRPYSHRSSHKTSNDPSISLSICTSAANNTIEMASNMMRAIDTQRGVSRLKGMLHSSVFIFFTAGIVHITNCTSADPVLAASAKLRTIETLKCLAVVEDVWITGRWCANNIAQLLKARSIVLPCSPEAFKSLPMSSVEDLKQRVGGSPTQMQDISMVASIPKEQSFAFDVNQILGYYQRNGTKHAEPMGRNSRHFSPTPYFSSAGGHHQPQSPMKSHPGLTQGHAPLPRRPRQGKNTSPSPNGSFTLATASHIGGTSTTPTNTVFPAMTDQFMSAVPISSAASDTSSVNSTTTLNDPFGTPGSATVTNNGLPPSPAETDMSFNSNPYQNPFSSSLWGIPTSMDSDEWMLYMQNGGANSSSAQSGMDLSAESAGSTPGLKTASEMFGPIPDLTSNSFMDSNNVNMNMGNMNNSNLAPNSKSHPLSQSLTSNDLMGSLDHAGARPSSISSSSSSSGVILAPTSFSGATSSPITTATSSIPTTPAISLHQGSMLPGYQQHSMINNSFIPTSTSQQQQQHMPSEYDFLLGTGSLGVQQQQQQHQQQQLQLLQQQQF